MPHAGRTSPALPFRLAAGALAVGLMPLGGCNIMGPAFLLVHGPEKVPAAYELDKERTAVVFVDDRGNHLPRRSMRVALSAAAERLILKKELVKDMISGQSALSAAGLEKGGQLLSIADVGRSVGADQVIYVSIDSFSLTTDGQTFEPQMVMRVKVVDAINDKRMWPEDRAGQTMLVRVGAKQGGIPEASTERARAEDELATAAGEQLARLFFKHEKVGGPRAPTS